MARPNWAPRPSSCSKPSSSSAGGGRGGVGGRNQGRFGLHGPICTLFVLGLQVLICYISYHEVQFPSNGLPAGQIQDECHGPEGGDPECVVAEPQDGLPQRQW